MCNGHVGQTGQTLLDMGAKFHMWEVVVCLIKIYFSGECRFKILDLSSHSTHSSNPSHLQLARTNTTSSTSASNSNSNGATFLFLHQAAVHGRVEVFRKYCLCIYLDIVVYPVDIYCLHM